MMTKRYILGIIAALLCYSCSKSEIETYHSEDGVYFPNSFSAYSFLEHYENKLLGRDTLYIPVEVTGNATDYDREVTAEIVRDSLYTSNDTMFMLLKGIVKANEYKGELPIVIFYDPAMDDSTFVARIRLSGNSHFPDQALNYKTYSVNFTNMVNMPENWSKVRSRFGTKYSNSWYSFILSVMEMSYIPYWSYSGAADSKNPDPEKYWMTYNQLSAYVSKVKVALQDYNNSPQGPLLHEDGEYKGQPVTM